MFSEMRHYGLPGGMCRWLECSFYLGIQVYEKHDTY